MAASIQLDRRANTPIFTDLVKRIAKSQGDLGSTRCRLEQETGIFFDLKYFKRLMMAGEFDQADRYLSGFISLRGDDVNSVKMFWEIRKQKYLEALDRKDSLRAVNILGNDMKVFKEFSPDVHLQLVNLLTLDDFRENEQLQDYSRDTKAQRAHAFLDIKKLIQRNDDIQHKLTFPAMEKSRLRLLTNQRFYISD